MLNRLSRSVHNIRAERMWVDVTTHFGRKWKLFFRLLEVSHNLDADLDAHIWLLQYLFLSAINEDARAWANAWNNHTLSSRSETYRTPRYMYTHGMVHHGIRGVFAPVVTEDPEDPGDQTYEAYGVDFDELDDDRIVNHFREQNQAAEGPDAPTNPFETSMPEHLSHVEIPDFRCPFDSSQLARLEALLSGLPFRHLKDERSRVLLWTTALQYCSDILNGTR